MSPSGSGVLTGTKTSTPPASRWFSFDGGVEGNTIAVTDAFGVPFTSVSAGTATYSASAAKIGLKGVRMTSNVPNICQWDVSPAVTKHSLADWFRASTRPLTDARLFDLRNTPTAGTVCGVILTTTGRFRIMQGTVSLGTGESPVTTLSAWYWVNLTWDCTAKIARLRVYLSDGTLWHDSGAVAVTTSYINATTSRWLRPVSWDAGTVDNDEPQWNPGSTTPLFPWGGSKSSIISGSGVPKRLGVGGGSVPSTGTMSGSGTRKSIGSGTLDSVAELDASGAKRAFGIGLFEAVSDVSGAGFSRKIGGGVLNGDGHLYISGKRRSFGSGMVDLAAGELLGKGIRVSFGSGIILSNTLVEAGGLTIRSGVGYLSGLAVIDGLGSKTESNITCLIWNGEEYVRPMIWNGQAYVPLQIFNGAAYV